MTIRHKIHLDRGVPQRKGRDIGRDAADYKVAYDGKAGTSRKQGRAKAHRGQPQRERQGPRLHSMPRRSILSWGVTAVTGRL